MVWLLSVHCTGVKNVSGSSTRRISGSPLPFRWCFLSIDCCIVSFFGFVLVSGPKRRRRFALVTLDWLGRWRRDMLLLLGLVWLGLRWGCVRRNSCA